MHSFNSTHQVIFTHLVILRIFLAVQLVVVVIDASHFGSRELSDAFLVLVEFFWLRNSNDDTSRSFVIAIVDYIHFFLNRHVVPIIEDLLVQLLHEVFRLGLRHLRLLHELVKRLHFFFLIF